MKLIPKNEQRIAFIIAVFGGAFVWVASPYITGQREPWDSETSFYPCILFLTALFAGLIMPSRFWRWALGVWLGQIVGFLWCLLLSDRIGPLAAVGFLLFLPLYSLCALLGAAVAAAAHSLLRQFKLHWK
jgi:hypothetical protein